jgi:hypothetical protein
MKTLTVAAKELKESIAKAHKARLEFMKAYEASIEAQMEIAKDRDDNRFADKFDFTTRQTWDQR